MPIIGLKFSEKEKSFISSEDMEVDSSTQKQRNLANIDGYQIAELPEKGSESNVSLVSMEGMEEPSGSMDWTNDSRYQVSSVETLSDLLELLPVREAHGVSLSGFEEGFFEAIRGGDLIAIQSYLENKYITPQTFLKVWVFEGKSYTPLELAIQCKHFDILKRLLFSEKCTEEIVGCRVDKGKDISILNYAFNLNNAEACRLILKCPQFKPEHFLFKPFSDSNEFKYHSYYSLALSYRYYDILQVFIDELSPETLKEVLLDQKDIEDSCLFKLHCMIRHPLIKNHSSISALKNFLLQIYRVLCCCKQDLQAQEAQAFILKSAIFYKDFELFERILCLDEFHISVLGVQGEKDFYVLWEAMEDEKIGKRLLSLEGIPEEIFLEIGSNGLTPLHRAVKCRQQELIKMYLSPESVIKTFPKKAVFIPDALGNSILHSAIESKDMSIIEILLSSNYGKQLLKMSNNNGQTPREYLEALMSFKIGKYSMQGYESIKSKIAHYKSRRADISSRIENMEKNYSTDVLDSREDREDYAILKTRLVGVEDLIRDYQTKLDSWAQLQQEEHFVLKKVEEKIIHYSSE